MMMKNQVTRRDFLKLSGLLPLSVAAPQVLYSLDAQQKQQNVLIIVFDALSARNMSLHGYPRETTPNLSRLAERAVVYHNHYAGANFTTPGTASLLTGTLPWTHRAFQVGSSVSDLFEKKNLFTAFQNYHRISYSHNNLVDMMIRQFKKNIDELMRTDKLLLRGSIVPIFFEKDEDIFTVSWMRYFEKRLDGNTYSLFLSYLNELRNLMIDASYASLKLEYPRGIPGISDSPGHFADFLLEDAIDWLQENLGRLPQPFMGYFHFYPPHDPYRTHREFYGRYKNDKYTPTIKQPSIFSANETLDVLLKYRTEYDEFILYVDREFGRLFEYLDASGISDNTWIIMTSDHGEMFERGTRGHVTKVLYEPVIHIPLMIFEPGRKSRLDVHTPTSAVDILPTLLHVTGQQSADWVEGVVLPPFSDSALTMEKSRSIYVLEAKRNRNQNSPLTFATVALFKKRYKLMYFFGYEELGGSEHIELYDLNNDPEELNDLSSSKREITAELLNEIKRKLAEVNEPFL